MKTCISFMKVITSIKELNIALEHVTGINLFLIKINKWHNCYTKVSDIKDDVLGIYAYLNQCLNNYTLNQN